MTTVRLSPVQVLTLKNVLEGLKGFSLADLRLVDRAVEAIDDATAGYRARIAARAGDRAALDELIEAEGHAPVDVDLDDDARALCLRAWRAVPGWSAAPDVRRVVLAVEDALATPPPEPEQ